MAYFDDDGNPVEGVLSPDEAKALQEKAQKAEELEKAFKEKEEELSKFKEKDLNFTNFRKKTEEEQQKALEKMGAEKRMIMEQLLTMQKERETENQTKMEATRTSLLEALAGDDEELKKNIELRAKEWGECKTVEEMKQRYNDAAILLKSDRPRVSPFNSYFPTTSYNAPQNQKKFTETPEGKESMQKWFPDIAKKIYK